MHCFHPHSLYNGVSNCTHQTQMFQKLATRDFGSAPRRRGKGRRRRDRNKSALAIYVERFKASVATRLSRSEQSAVLGALLRCVGKRLLCVLVTNSLHPFHRLRALS